MIARHRLAADGAGSWSATTATSIALDPAAMAAAAPAPHRRKQRIPPGPRPRRRRPPRYPRHTPTSTVIDLAAYEARRPRKEHPVMINKT